MKTTSAEDIATRLPDVCHAIMVRLLDLVSPTRLSENGDKLLNRYAVTGFQRLQAGMLQPDNLEDFLVGYHGLWADGEAPVP